MPLIAPSLVLVSVTERGDVGALRVHEQPEDGVQGIVMVRSSGIGPSRGGDAACRRGPHPELIRHAGRAGCSG